MATITTLTGSDGITTADSMTKINDNFSNLNTDKIETSYLDTDTTLAANSDTKIPSQKAVKAYVDTGGNVNASETTKGIVEEATAAEVLAGTAAGATGARLFVNPSTANFAPPIVITYLTGASPATWSKPASLKYISVEVVGGGGAGAVADNGGGGGGGGAYAKGIIPVSALGATETVTIGAAGATSSFGSHIVCTAGAAGNSTTGGASGAASGTYATFQIENWGGTNGSVDADTTPDFANGGLGGGSVYGQGGQGVVTGVGGASGSLNGMAATGYGAGGGGGITDGSGESGGAGAPGIVIVTEHYI